MKRIAVCISGQIRTWRTCLPALIRFYESHPDTQVDYFYHTWNVNEKVQERGQQTNAIVTEHVSDDVVSEINALLKPKKYKVTHTLFNIMNSEIYNDRWVNLFYSLTQSLYLKKEYELEHNFKYDLVIKSRFDIIHNNASILPTELLSMIPLSMITTHCNNFPCEYNRYNFSDISFYGTTIAMDMLANLVYKVVKHNINSRQINDNRHRTSIETYDVGPGVIIFKYLCENGIKPMDRFNLHEYIVREDSDINPLTTEGFLYFLQKHKEWYIK